jgi:hypothetical protein
MATGPTLKAIRLDIGNEQTFLQEMRIVINYNEWAACIPPTNTPTALGGGKPARAARRAM